ncbi:NAD(P)-dependent dehydrogenase (short-subunit alcohol dehydrogenase family) [Litoreibacter ponti]|uniref:NAD(P)-dependent dehydrogenase (Short-subunit alcohol dehydrogenase family) n=1 Tax=Litoreibacter ponti TaxID=1510457 RepID=A0A2T6BPI7_9RHOB|nr:SDR family oxidoreductase [Litoreibacter ponti]PTX57989.1 NAD(P)-dependent dehydrogenase (short-subunit alcohol dehydrogenase family) [Litoreibacter ponti]
MSNRTAIVTGAARGIGLATTKLLLDEGVQVAMVDWDAEELARASDGLENVLAIPKDVSNPAQVVEIVAETEAVFGGITHLINNAGVADFGPMEGTDFDRWRNVMQVNLDGVFLMTQAAAPALKKANGSIVNIASISGLRASTLRVAYGTSKAGVIQLTQQQAVELGEHGVRVNCVAPGPVRTKLAMAVHTQEIIDAYHDAIPLNRYGNETEIANVIAFLLSDRASYVTGQTIAVDGGFECTGVGLPALRAEPAAKVL